MRSWIACCSLLLFGAALPLRAAPPIEPEVVPLWPEGSPGNTSEIRPNLEIFRPFSTGRPAPATVIVLPGGGYGQISPYERHQAEYFRALGYAAVVVNYRVAPHRHPAAFADAARAIRLVRRFGREWGLPSDRIVLLGGSAGGHLAALVATRPDLYRDPADDLAEGVGARPDRLILLYPMIATSGPDAHAAAIERLLGPAADEDLRAAIDPARHVTRATPPTLIFHAADDPLVGVNNSVRFARACWAADVPAELHVFPRGGHGRDFAYDAEVSPRWRRLVEDWLAEWARTNEMSETK